MKIIININKSIIMPIQSISENVLSLDFKYNSPPLTIDTLISFLEENKNKGFSRIIFDEKMNEHYFVGLRIIAQK